MQPHQSLRAPPVAVRDLNPVIKMPRNDKCWCESGLKWKNCHERRGQAPRPPISDIFDQEKLIVGAARCLHPLAEADCGNRIVAAHSVQKKVGLKAIEENGHVLSVRRSIGWLLKNGPDFAPERQGVQNASTFRGFCDKHDTSLFRPVETRAWHASKETAFLLSFRAVSYELYAKLNAKKLGLWQKLWVDCGFDFDDQVNVQKYLHDYLTGIDLGVKDSLIWKQKYDDIFLSANYNDYHYLCIEFSPPLPIVACGGMHVEYDFQGNTLQNLMRNVSSYEHMTFNITVAGDVSIVVLGWVGDPEGPSHRFAQSLLAQRPDRLSQAVIRLAFENFENTYMRESWWDGLSHPVRNAIKHRVNAGAPDSERLATCLMEDNIDFFKASSSTTGLVM